MPIALQKCRFCPNFVVLVRFCPVSDFLRAIAPRNHLFSVHLIGQRLSPFKATARDRQNTLNQSESRRFFCGRAPARALVLVGTDRKRMALAGVDFSVTQTQEHLVRAALQMCQNTVHPSARVCNGADAASRQCHGLRIRMLALFCVTHLFETRQFIHRSIRFNAALHRRVPVVLLAALAPFQRQKRAFSSLVSRASWFVLGA